MIDQQQMLPIGSLLHGDTYWVVRYIASGGFGNTYEVEHVKLGKRYCLKEFFMRGINLRRGTTVTVSVEDNRSTFEQMRTKFFKEAQRMARIENLHVVEVTDCFEENQTAYYVMKLIDGQSLSDRMAAQGRPFTEAEVRTMLPQVLSALRCVHNQGIYHLDLKPANIMASTDGHLWLIDFGACKQLSASESQTLSTSTGLCYTPNYAPSELVSGNTKRIGPWTDFYSLGATFYNLLTNHHPPETDDVRYDGKRAFQFPASVSADMRSLILWLMSPDYPQRPQSVEEIEQRLSVSIETPEEPAELETTPTEETEKAELGTKTVKADVGTPTVKAEQSPSMSTVDFQAETPKKSKVRINASIIIGIVLLYIFGFVLLQKMGKNRAIEYEAPSLVEDETPVPPSTFPAADNPEELLSTYCPDSNHPHAIDLSLPSGTKWACCNVGATAPEKTGDYYAWGETEEKDTYYWDSYRHGSSEETVKNIGNDIAGTLYDVAYFKWTGSWRIPSQMQIQELIDNTRSTWTTVAGVSGRQFTSEMNGAYIFLPAAGQFCYSNLYEAGVNGSYWSSTICAGRPYCAFALDFSPEGLDLNGSHGRSLTSYGRFYGLSVRPVRQ